MENNQQDEGEGKGEEEDMKNNEESKQVGRRSADDEVSTLDLRHYDRDAFQDYPTSIGDGRQHSLLRYLR